MNKIDLKINNQLSIVEMDLSKITEQRFIKRQTQHTVNCLQFSNLAYRYFDKFNSI